MSLKDKQQLELAEQQLVGFAHASKGYGIVDLAQSMGLKKSEWKSLKGKVHLKPSDEQELDEHFKRQH